MNDPGQRAGVDYDAWHRMVFQLNCREIKLVHRVTLPFKRVFINFIYTIMYHA